MWNRQLLALSLLVLPALASAQAVDPRIFYYPKPIARTPWQPPMKPVTRLADVRSRHQGVALWRELVIHDENSRAFIVEEPAGTRHERKLYPDSPAWWAVLDGRIRFEVKNPTARSRRSRRPKVLTSSCRSGCCTRSRWLAISRRRAWR